MSAFDDEFGLFGDENVEEEERKSTLGARTISTGETIIDDIEPEDERPRRRMRSGPPEKREFTPIPGATVGGGWSRRRRGDENQSDRDRCVGDVEHVKVRDGDEVDHVSVHEAIRNVSKRSAGDEPETNLCERRRGERRAQQVPEERERADREGHEQRGAVAEEPHRTVRVANVREIE